MSASPNSLCRACSQSRLCVIGPGFRFSSRRQGNSMGERFAIGKRLEIGCHGQVIAFRMAPLMEMPDKCGLFKFGMGADILRGCAPQCAFDIQGGHEALRPNKVDILYLRAFLAVGEKFAV